jgi:hypothetical protein
MARGDFLQLPVHPGGAVVVNLDAIHAHVAFARVRVAVTTQGSVMKRPPSSGQHLRMGKLRSVGIVASLHRQTGGRCNVVTIQRFNSWRRGHGSLRGAGTSNF